MIPFVMSKPTAFWLALVTALTCCQSHASETGMRFALFEPCDGNGSMCATRIIAKGVIESDTPDRFREFLASTKRGKLAGVSAATVVFDSPGGNVIAAVQLGRLIRAARIETELAAEYTRVIWEAAPSSNRYDTFVSHAACASACTLAFVGGVKRSVADNARFGVHQFSATKGQVGDGVTQITVVALAEYLQEMGVDRRMLDRASVVDPTSIAWLSHAEVNAFRIDNTRNDLQAWSLKATDAGEPLLFLEQGVGPGKSLRMMFTQGQNGVLLAVLQVQFETAVIPLERVKYFPAGEMPSVYISADGKPVPVTPLDPWSREDQSSRVRFTCVVLIGKAGSAAVQRSRAVELDDGFPNAIGDLRYGSSLSTQGLRSGLALLLRK